MLGKIGARLGLKIGEKAAAELVPIAGAAGGLTLNVLFARYFQLLAEAHFTIRRLERKHGAKVVCEEYERIRNPRFL
ncbi:MAG TPA: hypothetical protein VMU57_11305 [Edaphobacter sp.]|uniref:hypothetical protein n=1 Tax=Edaphobacter sp. TaxID=1934404 RepID=UPI002C74CA24|nr:hypothetical protein [Edaphobacter sp.]HUZ95490.1 hypothetical protein [Edaphobacter sp.]